MRSLFLLGSHASCALALFAVSTPSAASHSAPIEAPAPTHISQVSEDRARWFSEDVHPHDASLKAYLRVSFPSVRDVDDVVQESYLRVWKARATQPIQSAKAFLFTVARRLALDWVRHERRSPVDSVGSLAGLDVLDDGPNTHEIVNKREKIEILVEAIDSLPPRCRKVIFMNKIQLIPAREISVQLGITERGVEAHLERGLGRIREVLRRRGIRSLLGPDA